MTTDMIVAPAPAPKPLDLALLKAVGLDRAAPEQRQLAIAIAERYGLDLMLKHLVLIEGRPYVTRDALLHIAHRSGQFDGIQTTTPEVVGDEWRCLATVWRKDMGHPFTYGGRYPVKGRNANFAPEMAIKVAESMALRRAFNVAAPVAEERWDVDLPTAVPEPKLTLAERAKAAEIIEAPVIADSLGDQPRPVARRSPRPPVAAPEPPGATETGATDGVAAETPVATERPAAAPREWRGLSFEAFSAAVRQSGATEQHVIDAARWRFPESKRLSALTDEERGLLFADIEDALAGDREAVLS